MIYDPVGGELCEQAFRGIGWNGRYLVIGFVAGIPKFPTNLALLKGASLVGVFWGAFTMREAPIHLENVAELLNWYNEGKVKPAISKVYPMADAASAIEALSQRQAKGKLVVSMT